MSLESFWAADMVVIEKERRRVLNIETWSDIGGLKLWSRFLKKLSFISTCQPVLLSHPCKNGTQANRRTVHDVW